MLSEVLESISSRSRSPPSFAPVQQVQLQQWPGASGESFIPGSNREKDGSPGSWRREAELSCGQTRSVLGSAVPITVGRLCSAGQPSVGGGGATGLLLEPSFFTGEVELPLTQLALPWIDLSRKANPTNGSRQAHVGELLGFIPVFLYDFCSCLNPPDLHSGHGRRLQEEQMPLELSVVRSNNMEAEKSRHT